MPEHIPSGHDLPPLETQRSILALRLLIARAGGVDSLAWWEDHSFTDPATYVFDRLFPVSPPLAARTLALRAAWHRHQAACDARALHLYRLDPDNRDALALRDISPLNVDLPTAPIPSMEALRAALLALTGKPRPYRVIMERAGHALHIELPPAPPGVEPLLHRAQTLAWAYLQGAPGQPLFPFCYPG
ncbi:MAG TPA: BrxE family protein [Anaerolineae bacterium]|nr:BrxE family protein [Anaerolineae bacterium]